MSGFVPANQVTGLDGHSETQVELLVLTVSRSMGRLQAKLQRRTFRRRYHTDHAHLFRHIDQEDECVNVGLGLGLAGYAALSIDAQVTMTRFDRSSSEEMYLVSRPVPKLYVALLKCGYESFRIGGSVDAQQLYQAAKAGLAVYGEEP